MTSIPSSPSTNTIKTPRLLLHPLTHSDSPSVYALRSDPLVFYWKTPDTQAQSDKWLHERLASGNSLIYLVELLSTANDNHSQDPQTTTSQPSTRNIIGITGSHTLPEVGYIFTPSAWGKGYATEALRAWMVWYWRVWPEGFPVEGERGFLTAQTGPEGMGSRRVLIKCGFAHVGKEQVEDEGKGGNVVVDCWRCERPGSGSEKVG